MELALPGAAFLTQDSFIRAAFPLCEVSVPSIPHTLPGTEAFGALETKLLTLHFAHVQVF